jgi:multidrug resistance efflux pump
MCVIEYSSREQITPNSPGWLKQWFIHEGSHVEPGQILAKLENPALEDAVKEAMLGKEAANVQWRAALESQDESIRLTAPALEKSGLELDEQLHSLEGQFSRLTVRATAPGIVLQSDLEHELGQYFPIGRLLLQIGDDRAFNVILPLNEKQARQVRIGNTVSLHLRAYPDQKIQGHIITVPTAASEVFSTPLMASALGGEFPSESTKKAGELPKPAIPCYEVVVRLDSVAEPLRPGMMGRASIVTGTATLGSWLGQQVFDWLNPALRL